MAPHFPARTSTRLPNGEPGKKAGGSLSREREEDFSNLLSPGCCRAEVFRTETSSGGALLRCTRLAPYPLSSLAPRERLCVEEETRAEHQEGLALWLYRNLN